MTGKQRPALRFGAVGLGAMGREFASALARWCHLLDDGPAPVLTAICARGKSRWDWYRENFPAIELATTDYRELIESDKVDVVYCAAPHDLHESICVAALRAGKHLLGEKPFGIDKGANERILAAVRERPDRVVRCTSQFPYFPGAQRLIRWAREKRYGRLIEVRAGFHHASDVDLSKPLNWKRVAARNGEYGCMGDLGMHVQHIPFRMGWLPRSVYADLQKIAETRPDGKGGMAPCDTWDNATLLCNCLDPDNGKEFTLTFETKRMAPGQTNTWFIEVYGTAGSARFSTHEPKAFYYLETAGTEQGWTRVDVGSQSAVPSITPGIVEFGFSDAFQQMIGVYVGRFKPRPDPDVFDLVRPEETAWSHRVFTAALESHRMGRRVELG